MSTIRITYMLILPNRKGASTGGSHMELKDISSKKYQNLCLMPVHLASSGLLGAYRENRRARERADTHKIMQKQQNIYIKISKLI